MKYMWISVFKIYEIKRYIFSSSITRLPKIPLYLWETIINWGKNFDFYHVCFWNGNNIIGKRIFFMLKLAECDRDFGLSCLNLKGFGSFYIKVRILRCFLIFFEEKNCLTVNLSVWKNFWKMIFLLDFFTVFTYLTVRIKLNFPHKSILLANEITPRAFFYLLYSFSQKCSNNMVIFQSRRKGQQALTLRLL